MDECKKTVGSLLVVYVYILGRKLIAEVITERPLTLKIGEMPEYEGLEVEEFEILEKDSIEFQNNETRSDLLLNHKLAGDAIVCGLERLGVTDGEFYEMLPADYNSN